MIPTVSVIFPVYGRFNLLKHAVESVLAQTHPVTEVILVDDGSIDETPRVLPRYIEENPAWRERVRYFYQQNQGQAAAVNTGIANAKGEWLGFLGTDDLWLPWKLEWQFRALEKFKDQCALCFLDAWFMNNPHMKTTVFQLNHNQGHELMGMIRDPARLIVNEISVWCQTVIVRADLARSVGGFDPYLRWSEDRDFLFRTALASKFCYVGIPLVLIDRSPHEVKHMGEAENWHREEFCLQMDQYLVEKQSRLGAKLEPDIRKSILRNHRDLHGQWASLYLENREFQKARESLSTAIGFCFGLKVAIKWLLARLSPELARKIVIARKERAARCNHPSSWQDEPKENAGTGSDGAKSWRELERTFEKHR